MTYSYKVLGEGQLASSKGTLYTVPGSTQAAIKSISIFNAGAGNNVIRLYLKPGSTSRQVCAFTLLTGETLVLDDIGTLEAADLIEGYATNASECDYTIMGAEAS